LTVSGLAVGIAIALGVTRLVSGMLIQAAALLPVVPLLANYVPALGATHL
jgi:hypothetical protein